MSLPYDSSSVAKVKETPELKSMQDVAAREKALRGAFRVDGKKLSGKRVILFDDLYRSGASMEEVARTLQKQAGVKTVIALALTRTRSNT